MSNRLIFGTTRISGKSNLARLIIREEVLKKPNMGAVILDPQPDSTGWAVFKDCIASGQGDRVIFDDLDDWDHVLPWIG